MFSESAHREQQGVTLVQAAFVDLGWIFRPQPTADTGIDAIVEVVEEGEATGRLIGVQIKCGRSFFREVTPEGWRYRGEHKHLDYWREHTLPVIVVVCDPDAKVCYWVEIGPDSDVDVLENSWTIVIPKQNHLGSARTIDALRSVAQGLSRRERNLARLESDTSLMLLLAQGRELRLEIEEWVNKSSGRGSFKVLDVTDGSEAIVAEWFGLAPGWDYASLVRFQFPWAAAEIDEDFYESYDEAKFDLERGIYDREDDRYYHYEDFGEWRSRLPAFRPYESVGGGEVDHFYLRLTLNEVGRAWLTIQDFAAQGGHP